MARIHMLQTTKYEATRQIGFAFKAVCSASSIAMQLSVSDVNVF